MRRAVCAALVAAVLFAGHDGPVARAEQAGQGAQEGGYAPLRAELRRILAEADLDQASLGAIAIDVETGEVLFEHEPDLLLNPASNAKIVTAAAALSLLGPEYRFVTSLSGEAEGAAVEGPLYLRGRGDPTLTSEDLLALAGELRRRGIRAVRGDLVVDATYFDSEVEPPAFDQQPQERSYFRTTVGAVNFNHNVAVITVRPGPGAGRPALVTVEPEGYLELVNDSVTIETGPSSIRISTRPGDRGTRARVWGSIPLGDAGTQTKSRIDNPSLFAGAALVEALRAQGIRFSGQVLEGEAPATARMLADHVSPPLSSILLAVGKDSDNFTAETLLKTLGAQQNAHGTWERGREAVRGFLDSLGFAREAYRLVNGSGLFNANRYTVRQLATVLRAAWLDQRIHAEFVAQLATAGVDGTLDDRFRRPPLQRNVRAKTGTLAGVTALSGYVLAPAGRHTIAFSILANGPGAAGVGHTLQEQIVTALAEHLHGT